MHTDPEHASAITLYEKLGTKETAHHFDNSSSTLRVAASGLNAILNFSGARVSGRGTRPRPWTMEWLAE
jgi:hypothetical protein